MVFLGTAVLAVIIMSSIAPAILAWAKARFLLNKNHAPLHPPVRRIPVEALPLLPRQNSSELGKNVLDEAGTSS